MLLIILKEVLLLTMLFGVLTTVIVIAKMIFSNYGDCTITINKKRDIVVTGGASLLSSLADKDIFVPSACGGRGTCGACKCRVDSGGGPVLPTEKPMLTAQELKDNVRLACQVKVKEAISIEIPEEIFNVRKFKAKITEIVDYTHDIKGITFKLLEPSEMEFKAGQYVQLLTPRYAKQKQSVSRAYSISSKPSLKNQFQLIIRRVPEGICTTWAHDYLKVGDEVNLTGPYGDFFIRDTNADILFVAGGSGKAPIKSMLEDLAEKGTKRRMAYFFGAQTQKDLYLTEYMEEFSTKFDEFNYYPILSHPADTDNWQGRKGFVMPYFSEFLKDPKNTEAYLCGSPRMIDSVCAELIKMGVLKENIYYDSF
jgi:Na+-transporting NADH:ubiquinone oxidoreductase subunit F